MTILQNHFSSAVCGQGLRRGVHLLSVLAMAIDEQDANIPLAAVLRAGFPVQFLAAHGLTEEAVRQAEHIEYEGVPAAIFRAEHIVAIAASVGRQKDRARRKLARESFEEKIRKVGQLIRLVKTFPRRTTALSRRN